MTTPEIPDVAVWAAAEAMYIQRPANTDPKHWETPWEDVPEGWKRGQHRAARQVLEAAFRGEKRAERPQKRGNTAKTGSSEENAPLSAPVTLPASVYHEALAAAWDNGYQAAKYEPHTTNPFKCHTKENQS